MGRISFLFGSAIRIFIFLYGISIIWFITRAIYRKIHHRTGAYYHCTKRPLGRVYRHDGSRCEVDTYEAVRKMEKKGWRFLCDLYIPKEDGTTTEVDMVGITPNGIIVFESKEYSGEIYGSERDTYWRQEWDVVGSNRETERSFYNPMKQNFGHIKNLKRLFGENFDFKSLIVFSDRCKVYVGRHGDPDTRIGQVKNALRHARDLDSEMTGPKLSKADIKQVYTELEKYTNVSKAVKKAHVQHCNAIAQMRV